MFIKKNSKINVHYGLIWFLNVNLQEAGKVNTTTIQHNSCDYVDHKHTHQPINYSTPL